MFTFLICTAVLACAASGANGHGMVTDPPNRASRWREDPQAPANYDDNGFFCGGMNVQFGLNGGKCGLCGDNYADATPRTNELGATPFGEGIIVRKYTPGSVMSVKVLVTANHLGSFAFNLCSVDKFKEESEECFQDILLKQITGETSYVIDERTGEFDVLLQLPENLSCEHCILRWTWTTGNSWGECVHGGEDIGCGTTQETFRTCSDISVLA